MDDWEYRKWARDLETHTGCEKAKKWRKKVRANEGKCVKADRKDPKILENTFSLCNLIVKNTPTQIYLESVYKSYNNTAKDRDTHTYTHASANNSEKGNGTQ